MKAYIYKAIIPLTLTMVITTGCSRGNTSETGAISQEEEILAVKAAGEFAEWIFQPGITDTESQLRACEALSRITELHAIGRDALADRFLVLLLESTADLHNRVPAP